MTKENVLNKNQVMAAVDEARNDLGKISGFVHGAGVLADRLIEDKKNDLTMSEEEDMLTDQIRLREELAEQIKALEELKQMAKSYGTIILLSWPILVFNIFLMFGLRLDGNPQLLMKYTLVGTIANIIFNYFFVCYHVKSL